MTRLPRLARLTRLPSHARLTSITRLDRKTILTRLAVIARRTRLAIMVSLPIGVDLLEVRDRPPLTLTVDRLDLLDWVG